MLSQRGGSKADTVVKLVLIFFISLLSFSVGTFVGKQVSDSDYKRASLEEDYKSFRQVSHTEEGKDDPTKKLSNEELTSLTEEFVTTEKEVLAASKAESVEEEKAEELGTPVKAEKANKSGYKKYSKEQLEPSAPSKTVEHKADNDKKIGEHKSQIKQAEIEKSNSSVAKEAQRVADGKAPVADQKEIRRPTSILPSVATSSIGKYTIQVASYANEDEAKAHANELKQKGWNAFYLPAEISSKTWFRVSIGLFTDQKSAGAFREELMKQSAISSSIIQRIVE
jgi:cell division septation protein DedD